MRIEEIRKVQRAQPFRPFTLHLADGREFQINHPEFLFLGHSERTAIVDDVDGSFEVIDPLLVTSLSVAPVKTEQTSTSN
jgi:hypothetical protein